MHIYTNIKLFVFSRWQKYEKAPSEKDIPKTAKSKPTSNKLKAEICFTLKMHYFLQ